MLHQVADIFLSLLPARYRRRYQMDPVAGAICSGIVQVAAAFFVYAALFFRYLQEYGALSGSMMASPAAAGQGLAGLRGISNFEL